jgi:hypothetical protein
MHQAGAGEGGQQGQVGAQPLGWRGGGRIPEGVLPIKSPLAIGQQPKVIPGAGGASREGGSLKHAQHRHRQGRVGAALVGVAAHHRDGEFVAGEAHPRQQAFGSLGAGTPEAVHQRQRPAAHRGDVAEVHEHAAPTGEPGVLRHQLRMHPLAGQQQRTVHGGQQGGVITEGSGSAELGEGLVGKGAGRGLDVALGEQAALALKAADEGCQAAGFLRPGIAHAANRAGRRSRAGA